MRHDHPSLNFALSTLVLPQYFSEIGEKKKNDDDDRDSTAQRRKLHRLHVVRDSVKNDAPTHLHLIRGANTYLYSTKFCLVEEIFWNLFDLFFLRSYENSCRARFCNLLSYVSILPIFYLVEVICILKSFRLFFYKATKARIAGFCNLVLKTL